MYEYNDLYQVVEMYIRDGEIIPKCGDIVKIEQHDEICSITKQISVIKIINKEIRNNNLYIIAKCNIIEGDYIMRILVDFDNTIANSSETIIKLYQNKTKDYSKKYNSKELEWDFSPYICGDDVKWALWEFSEQKFYDELEPIEGAIEVLDRLSVDNEIIIVTKKHPDAVSMNAQWIRNHLPFIKITIFLNQDGFDKSIINGDIIIDDKPECLIGGNRKFRLLFGEYAYQKPITYINGKVNKNLILRVNSWYDIEKFINSLNKNN